MKYLITGATGNIGSLVTGRLIEAGEMPCALSRDAKRVREQFGGLVEARVGDLAAPRADLVKVFQGCDALFLLNTGPALAERDQACALAARDAGIRHIVKLSTLDVLSGVGTGPWHARGEEAVRESGVPYTFIRSAAFMSNALSWADAIRDEGVLFSSTGEGKIAFIHPEDIAEVAVSILRFGEARNRSLVITGPEAMSYREMAMAIGEAVGKPVQYGTMTDTEAMDGAMTWADREYAEALVDIWRAVREGRLATVTDGVHQALGRAPRSFGDWVARNASYFAKKAGRRR